ncbi:dnaJ homolog subfamily C member 17-like [Zingiber officinale]|uniref:dnaJ homolog subfamily C member 17-like n=1 Tax=Zingiber officinale TaxID=94328 RepID=UPI001C4C3773|nr:dnaJ homolog subfamily C member 17-like [Zingiber officinale]
MAGGRGTQSADEEDVDHYAVLCLPSGEEGAKLSLKEIEKAYRNQSRIRHPDKRPDDPNATADFQRLKTSFEVLKDEAARRVFDARLRARRERILRDSAFDAKRRKLATDLEERERAAEEVDAADPAKQAERREKDVAARLQKELAEFQARKTKKPTAASNSTSKAFEQEKGEDNGGTALNKERMLKVSWESNLGDYTAVKLRELFERFGGVEDVVIRSKASKKRRSAIVVMSSKDAAVAATQSVCGSLSNPLLVLPVQAVAPDISSPFSAKSSESTNSTPNNIIGAGFQDYEASILKKLQKANELKKNIP